MLIGIPIKFLLLFFFFFFSIQSGRGEKGILSSFFMCMNYHPINSFAKASTSELCKICWD
jgi:hypothetical protein